MLKDRPGPATILVVDDQEAVSRLLMRWLEHLGFAVRVATSGEQALSMVRNQCAAADLILTDVNMPGMNGLELARSVLAEHPGRRMILMERRGGQLGDQVMVLHQFVPVLAKPLDFDNLLAHLRVMLPPRRRTPASASLYVGRRGRGVRAARTPRS